MPTALASLLFLLCPASATDAPAEPGWIKAVTAPSEDLSLAFVRSGRIAKVLVEEGRQVRPGQALVQLDDAVERTQAALLKAQAEDTTRVRAAQLQLARKKDVLQGIAKAHAGGASPKRELEEARLDAAMAELTLEMARLEHEQAKGRYREAQLMLERTRLASPVAGRVERILAKTGESVDALAPVVRLVRIDPLWVDVPVPLAQARPLKPGQPAHVRFGAAKPPPAVGSIVRVSSVADAGSETLEVRVKLPNPAGRPAGEHVTVRFPPAKPDSDAKAAPAAKKPAP